MAFIGAITSGISGPGDVLTLVDALFQKQVSIYDPVSDKSVYLNATEAQDVESGVTITDKPITDLGSAVDYISRNPEPMTLTGFISNRDVDLRRNPAGVVAGYASAFLPGAASAAAAAGSLAGKFVDLGKDEMDKKLETLHDWKNRGVFLDVLNAKINPKRFTKEGQAYRFLIENIRVTSTVDTGDGMGVQIVFKHIIVVRPTAVTGQGSFLKDTVFGRLKSTFTSPFS